MKKAGTFLLLVVLIGCKGRNFNGIQAYESIAMQNINNLHRAVAIINSNSQAGNTYVYNCALEDSTMQRLTIKHPELCEIFKRSNIEEAVKYNSGNIHIVFKRLLPDQNYGAYLTVDQNDHKNTATSKYYLKRLRKSNFYLNAEADW